MRVTTKSRAGFTLIEIMVAMALTLFVMVIMSQAFVIALDTFSGMKGIGDMQQNLRTVEVLLRDDLASDHFEGKRRLSDMNSSNLPAIVFGGTANAIQSPEAGFFAVRRKTPAQLPIQFTNTWSPFQWEYNDGNGIPSFHATDHVIYMTVKKRGNRPENFFTASLPEMYAGPTPPNPPPVLPRFFGQQTAYDVPQGLNLPTATYTQPYAGGPSGFYASQWTEVVYYLIQTGTTEEPRNAGSLIGTPTFGLYRAQFVMVPDATNLNANAGFRGPQYTAQNLIDMSGATQNVTGAFAGMSCRASAAQLTFYSPADAAKGNRVIPDLTAFTGNNNIDQRVFSSSTLVCPNVVSFQVHVMQTGTTVFDDMPAPAPPPPATVFPAALSAPFIYDTAKFGNAGYATNGLKAIQVTIRVWDPKTRQTRQVTMVQDL